MKLPLRIAVLECDTPLKKTQARYGSYGGVFEALLRAAAESIDESEMCITKDDLDITYWDVVTKMEYPKIQDIDAILLTGSRHSAYNNDEWILKLVDFTDNILSQNRVRTIGVCYGHQIVGRALGAEVRKNDKGWEVSVTPVQMEKQGMHLFDKKILNIQQMHGDIVQGYPRGVERLGHTDTCPNQGMYVPKHLITVQGHPEFTEQIVCEILDTRHKLGIFDDDVFKDGMRRVEKDHDGVGIGRAFLRFLLEN